MIDKIRATATAYLITAAPQVFATPPHVYEGLYANVGNSEYISVGIDRSSRDGTFVFVDIYTYSEEEGGTTVLACYGTPVGEEFRTNGSATKGTATFNVENLCYIGEAVDVSVDCTSDGEYGYASVGNQVIKDPSGTLAFHGTYHESRADCTISIDEHAWQSDYGSIRVSRESARW